MSLTKLSLGGNNDVIYKLFPLRESLASEIPAGDGNIKKLFLQCILTERSMQDVMVERSQIIFTAIAITRKIVQCFALIQASLGLVLPFSLMLTWNRYIVSIAR